MSKNRYADVLCLEHSRVKLALLDEDEVTLSLYIYIFNAKSHLVYMALVVFRLH